MPPISRPPISPGAPASTLNITLLAIYIAITSTVTVMSIVMKLRSAGALNSSPVWLRRITQALPDLRGRFLTRSRSSAVAPDERSRNVEPPRTVITHQGDGRVPQVGPARPTDLPPPRSSTPLA